MTRKTTVSTQVADVLGSNNGWANTDLTPTGGAQLRMLGALASQSGVKVTYPREGLTIADVQAAARLARFIGADGPTAHERLADAKARVLKMRSDDAQKRFMWSPAKFELSIIKRLNDGGDPLDCETANEALKHCGIEFALKGAAATTAPDVEPTDLDALFS